MASITQDLRFKQAVVEYSFKHGVTAAAKRYKRTRQWIYYWHKRYDGTIRSLAEYSRRPHSHPNAHTDAELKLIADMRKRNTGAQSIACAFAAQNAEVNSRSPTAVLNFQ